MPAGLGCTTNTTSSSKRLTAEYNPSENVQASPKPSYGKLYLSSQHPNDFETDLAYYSVSDSRVLDSNPRPLSLCVKDLILMITAMLLNRRKNAPQSETRRQTLFSG